MIAPPFQNVRQRPGTRPAGSLGPDAEDQGEREAFEPRFDFITPNTT